MDKPSFGIIKTTVNWISRSRFSVLGGIMLSVVTPVLLVSVFFDVQGKVQNPYFGFLIYLILGPLFLVGLVLFFVGIFISRGKNKEDIGLFTFEYLEEQFSRPGRYTRIRKHIFWTFSITFVTLFLVGLVSYTGFHYTESNAFCGQFCHQVMEPAFSSYTNSPHSRISCVNCHIGKSSEWTTKAKFSGAKQLISVMFDTYPRPIEPPLKSLRPERQTCEECHRPEMFHGDKLHIKDRFLPDEKNTHVQTAMLMRIGSGGYQGVKAHGIHWHVSEKHQVSFRYVDSAEKEILQVWLEDGTKTINFNKKFSDAETLQTPSYGEIRKMDCMDCHNRPTHIFLNADEAIDKKMSMGVISSDIPFIKRQAYDVVLDDYENVETALQSISRRLRDWYQQNYPLFYDNNRLLVDKAIKGVQQAYQENVFPDMNVKWGTYKDFVGHRDGTGCFRCHDGQHASENGQLITNDCNSCHIILVENKPAADVLKILTGNTY